MEPLRFRQIHLDFHTSEAIPAVGKEWDKGHFQQMLTLGRVNSINIFGKCHHGWCYYPTQVPLSAMHPTLKIDLLGAMIEAAHEIDVKTPVYISVGLDEKLVKTHTHWLRRNKDGSTGWVGWLQAGYHEFCLRSPYLDYVIAQAEEVARGYDGDGFWLDIVGPRDCACQYCVAELRARGCDPRDDVARRRLGRETYLNYARRMNAAIQAITPDTLIFHNGGHITRGDRELAFLNTHLELESLPTGGWGYDHFPLSARYVQGLDREVISMTGKFHTSWGEFGGYKHPNALRFEAALGLANGAKMCVGDQMHPFGRLDHATYQLIGAAYAEVQEKEAWCAEVTSVADVGVLSMEAVCSAQGATMDPRYHLADAGVIRVLQEGGILYDVIDTTSEFSKYAIIILPDAVSLDAALQQRLQAYLRQGGKIFATWESGLHTEQGRFLLDFGVEYKGEALSNPCYLQPRFPLAPWAPAAFVMYSHAKEITAAGGEVLADRQDAFFNRDYLHFCSHQHAPATQETAGPLMVGTASTVYLALPAFSLYAEKGQNVLREILLHGLHTLLTAPTLQTSLPAQGVQTVMRQQKLGRQVVHLLYASPVRRGQGIEVIEDIQSIRDVTVALRVDAAPTRVYLAPQGTDLPFTLADGVLHTTVPEVNCHQMVVVE